MRSRSEREIVLDILTRIRREQTYSHVAIREALDAAEESSMTTQQRAFIKRLTEGVIERRPELDEVIGRHTRKGTRIKPVIRDILRMGVYQILYMDAVPDSAACDEAVKLTKEQGKGSLSGFVNAVLRSVARENGKKSLSGEETTQQIQKQSGTAREAGAAERKTLDTKTARAKAADVKAANTKGARAKTADAKTAKAALSMPAWITQLWREQFSEEETAALIESMMEVRPVTIRIDERLTESEKETLLDELKGAGVKLTPGRFCSYAYDLRGASSISSLPGFKQGLWTVQDESSMLVAEAAGLHGGETVYDLCAAPGGKTLHCASKLAALADDRKNSTNDSRENCITDDRESSTNDSCENCTADDRESSTKDGRECSAEDRKKCSAQDHLAGGTVYAFDLSRSKTKLIRENAARMRLRNIVIAERDARIPFSGEEQGRADVLLCDLPCSGLGVMGHKRDIKYRVKPQQLSELAALQREILRAGIMALRPGGTLIYSTCTIDRQENEEIAAFIEEELGMIPDPLAPHLPEGIPGIRGHELQLLPSVHGTDGFYIARFLSPASEP